MSTQLTRDRTVLFDTSNPTVVATTCTLSADITSTDTALTLSASVPLNGIYITIGSEDMVVLTGAGTGAVTVTRGALGTTAASASAGAVVGLPGYNTFNLQQLAAVPNQQLFLSKNSTDTNYQIVTAFSGDTFPSGATSLILPDSLTSLNLLAPGAGSQWLVSASGGSGSSTGGSVVIYPGPISTVTGSIADRATFFAGLGSPIQPGSDLGGRHIVIRNCTPTTLFPYLTSPPATGDFIFDIQRSQDGGSTWASILINPVDIPPNTPETVSTTAFSAGSGLAAGNLLRLTVISSGNPPGFSNGFMCAISLTGDSIPGFDRCTFLLGLADNVPINNDQGVYHILTQKVKPSVVFVNCKVAPVADCFLDIQWQYGNQWYSIFPNGAPLIVPAGLSSVLSTTAFKPGLLPIVSGTLLRSIITYSASPLTGMGWNIAIDFAIAS